MRQRFPFAAVAAPVPPRAHHPCRERAGGGAAAQVLNGGGDERAEVQAWGAAAEVQHPRRERAGGRRGGDEASGWDARAR